MYCICFSASLFTVNVRGISSPFNGGNSASAHSSSASYQVGVVPQRFNDEPLFKAGDATANVRRRWDSDVGLSALPQA